MNWDDLNIRDKAAYIKAAVSNGVHNKDEIVKYYNKFQEGSYIQQGDGSMLSLGNTTHRPTGWNDNPEEWYNNGIPETLPEVSVSGHTPTTYERFKRGIKGAVQAARDYYTSAPITPIYSSPSRVSQETNVAASDPAGTMKAPFYMVPAVGTALSGYDYYKDPSLINGIGLGLSFLGDATAFYKPVKQVAKNVSKLSRMEKMYTGVPHNEIKETPGIYMDDNFLSNYDGDVWTSNSSRYADLFSTTGSNTGKNSIFDIWYDPKDFKVYNTPKPPEGGHFGWRMLPFELHPNKATIIPGSDYLTAPGRYYKDLNLKGDNSKFIESAPFGTRPWEGQPPGIKTDDVLKYATNNNKNLTKLYGISDGFNIIMDETLFSPGTKHLRYQFPHEMNATKFDVAKQLPWELPSFPNYGGAYNGMKEYSKGRYTNRYDIGSWVTNNTIPSDNTNVYNKAKTLNDVREYNNKIQRDLDNYRAYEWGDELYYNNPETLPEVEVRPSTWRNFRYGLLPENMRHMDASYTDPIYGIHYPQTAQQSVDNARNASYMIPGVGAVLTADDFREDPNYGTGTLLAMQTLPYLSTAGKFLKNKYGFVKQPDSFTRGIGNEMGLRDAVQSGVLRGNPRGTVLSAKDFRRSSKSNKFSQIFSSRKYPDLAQHYNNQVLVKEEFDEIKKNVNKWLEKHPEERSTELASVFRKADNNPLREFNSYDEYIKAMDAKAASLKYATTIGPDGQPLAYYYDTGINPLKDGYGYAKSDYGVQVRNASQYNPEIFDGHLHYSFPKAMPINDPNVSFYKNGPLGTTLKMNPKTGNSYLYEDLVTNPWNSFTEWQRAHPIFNRTIKAPIQ